MPTTESGNGGGTAEDTWKPPRPPLLSPSRPQLPVPPRGPNTGPWRAGCSCLGPGLHRASWDKGGGSGVLAPAQTPSSVEVCILPVTLSTHGQEKGHC